MVPVRVCHGCSIPAWEVIMTIYCRVCGSRGEDNGVPGLKQIVCAACSVLALTFWPQGSKAPTNQRKGLTLSKVLSILKGGRKSQ